MTEFENRRIRTRDTNHGAHSPYPEDRHGWGDYDLPVDPASEVIKPLPPIIGVDGRPIDGPVYRPEATSHGPKVTLSPEAPAQTPG